MLNKWWIDVWSFPNCEISFWLEIGLAFTGDIKDLSSGFERKLEVKNSLVVCFGEVLIDFVPTVGGVSLAEAPAFKKAPGGAPANVAVGISRLGGSSAFIGKVHFH